MNSFLKSGFQFHRDVIGRDRLVSLREEAGRLATKTGAACLRGIRQRSKTFNQLATDPAVLALIPKGFEPVRSLLFDKTPEENWPVLWHQDLTIAVEEQIELDGYGPWSVKNGVPHVQPPVAVLEKMVTARIHLDDAGADNGALRVIPGSHREGKIKSVDDSRDFSEIESVCECRAGDVLLLSPLILHASGRSKSPSHRRVVHFEYADLNSLDSALKWQEK